MRVEPRRSNCQPPDGLVHAAAHGTVLVGLSYGTLQDLPTTCPGGYCWAGPHRRSPMFTGTSSTIPSANSSGETSGRSPRFARREWRTADLAAPMGCRRGRTHVAPCCAESVCGRRRKMPATIKNTNRRIAFPPVYRSRHPTAEAGSRFLSLAEASPENARACVPTPQRSRPGLAPAARRVRVSKMAFALRPSMLEDR